MPLFLTLANFVINIQVLIQFCGSRGDEPSSFFIYWKQFTQYLVCNLQVLQMILTRRICQVGNCLYRRSFLYTVSALTMLPWFVFIDPHSWNYFFESCQRLKITINSDIGRLPQVLAIFAIFLQLYIPFKVKTVSN